MRINTIRMERYGIDWFSSFSFVLIFMLILGIRRMALNS